MFRKRKKIKRCTLFHPVSMLCQILQIPHQRFRTTGYIHDFIRSQSHYRGKKRLIASRTRRIHNDHIRMFSFFCHLYHKLSGIFIIKSNIVNMIALCIGDSILYRITV